MGDPPTRPASEFATEGSNEWNTRLQNLKNRFDSEFKDEEISKAMKERDGHAGRAAAFLQAQQEQRNSQKSDPNASGGRKSRKRRRSGKRRRSSKRRRSGKKRRKSGKRRRTKRR